MAFGTSGNAITVDYSGGFLEFSENKTRNSGALEMLVEALNDISIEQGLIPVDTGNLFNSFSTERKGRDGIEVQYDVPYAMATWEDEHPKSHNPYLKTGVKHWLEQAWQNNKRSVGTLYVHALVSHNTTGRYSKIAKSKARVKFSKLKYSRKMAKVSRVSREAGKRRRKIAKGR